MYRRLCVGLNCKGVLIPASDNVFDHVKNFKKDHYLSLYLYNEEQKNKFYEEKEKIDPKSGEIKTSINGAKNINDVVTDKLVFDFDYKPDPSKAQLDTIVLVKRLLGHGYKEDQILITFSGQKGFGVDLITNEQFTPEEFKTITKNLGGDLDTFDTGIFNASRVLRIPYTKHQDTGLYKTPLILAELEGCSLDTIKQMAKEEYEPEIFDNVSEIPASVLKLKEIKKEERKPTMDLNSEHLDLSKKPRWLSNWKYAIQEGFFPEGSRNHSLMILGATYRGQGFNKITSYRMLKGAAELQSQRTGQERYADEQIWLEIVEQVYDSGWSGGTYAEESFSDDLKDYLTAIGVPRAKAEEEEAFMGVEDVYDTFENFAENIEKNTIKTGIVQLDKLCRITTSMLVGVLGAPGSGKCHKKGTPIMMADGSIKNVEDVKPGDRLMGDDGTYRNVLSTCKGNELLYKVKQKNGDDYVVNKSHILSVVNSNKESGRKITDINIEEYLSKSEYFKQRNKGYKVGVEYERMTDFQIDPYFIGLWLGDGTSLDTAISTDKRDVQIKEYLEELAEEWNLKLMLKQIDSENGLTYRISSGIKNGRRDRNPFLTEMRYLNLIGNKHIPDEYLYSSKKSRLSLLAGLLDSDGHYERSKRNFDICLKNEKLLDQTIRLVRSLGFRAQKSIRVIKGVEYFRCYISGNTLGEIPTKLPRKQAESKELNYNHLSTLIEIEKIGEGDYYGFTLDGNHRYLLGDFTVTHNTASTLNILERHSSEGEASILFSFDMGKPLIYQKLVQKQTGMSSDRIFKIFVDKDEEEKQKIKQKINKAYENVQMCFKTGSTVNDMKKYILEYEQRTGKKVRMIAVDYLEKLVGPFSDATANSGYNAAKLQELCNELELCCLLLLQPQKMAGDPSDPLLTYRRVKGASVIEQDCRVIFSIFREGYHPQNYDQDYFITYAILKNTMGVLGSVDCYWDGSTGDVNEIDDEGIVELRKLRKRKEEKKAREDL